MLDNDRQQSRRAFLKTAGVTTAGITLSGCTNILGGDSGSDGVTIESHHYPTGDIDQFLETHTEKFEEETGITVEYETMQWDNGKTKQTTSMQNRTGPDVGEIPSTYIPQFAALDGFENINDIDVDIDASSFFDNPTEIGHYKDEFIGIPWFWGPRAHLSYTPPLKEAGIEEPPSTWDELVQKGNAFNEKNPDEHLFGIPAQENVSHFFADFLWQNGETLLTDDNTKAAFDSDRAVEALNFYKDLQSNHSVMPKSTAEWKGDARDNAFTNHKIQSTWASLATVDTFLEADDISESDIEISKLPAGPNGESATFYGLELVGIHPWTDHPEEAAEWLKYLARPEVNAEIAEMTGFLPSVKESFEQERFQDPVWQGFKELTSTGKTFPQVDGWSQVEGIINDAVSGVLVDAATGKWSEGDTRKALEDAAKQANDELE